MPPETVLNPSFLEFIQALNEKVTLECTRVQDFCPPHGAASVATLTAEVSTPLSTKDTTDLTVNPSDRIPRNQGSRNLEAYFLVEEPVAADKPVATGDPLSHRTIHPRVCKGRELDYSDDSRVQVLAHDRRLDARQLDSHI